MICGLLLHRTCLAGASLPVGPKQGLWLADITYIPTQEGFLYLAFLVRDQETFWATGTVGL